MKRARKFFENFVKIIKQPHIVFEVPTQPSWAVQVVLAGTDRRTNGIGNHTKTRRDSLWRNLKKVSGQWVQFYKSKLSLFWRSGSKCREILKSSNKRPRFFHWYRMINVKKKKTGQASLNGFFTERNDPLKTSNLWKISKKTESMPSSRLPSLSNATIARCNSTT